MVEFKIDQILPKDHFYAFKIFPGNSDKMKKEKSEIERLIKDASAHGRWYIDNNEEALNTPTAFDSDQACALIKKVSNFSQNIVSNQIKISQDLFKSETETNHCNAKIVGIN